MGEVYQVGLAFRLVKFGLIFIVAAMLLVVLNPAFDAVMSNAAAHTSTQAAENGQSYVQDAWDAAPWIAAILGMVQLVAGAVAESDRGVR